MIKDVIHASNFKLAACGILVQYSTTMYNQSIEHLALQSSRLNLRQRNFSEQGNSVQQLETARLCK